ncbi:MAG: efflux RND transporter permease subunit, partial [Pseudomonadota bacterium]
MNSLIDGAIDKARMVMVILVFALVAGTATYISLPKESEPEIDVPVFIITVPLEGISPEDSERLIVRVLETELQTIEGIKQMDGIASEGVGQVVLEFNISFDPEKAESDIRKKVDLAKRELPDEAKEPVITEINTSLFPILVVNLFGEVPERSLYRVARDLQDKLEALPGVLEARVQGEREEVLEIVVDPDKLESYNLSYQEILNTVSANNQLIPAGQIDTGAGRFPVKVPGLIRTAEDAFELPVRQSGNAVIKLSDVADIRRTFKDREVHARFNGKPAVSVQIIKRSGANILSTVDDVNLIIEEAEATWPDALQSEITSDQSGYIRSQITQLQASIMTAVVLVMIIVVAALGLRSAALVGVAIPASFVMAFLLLG